MMQFVNKAFLFLFLLPLCFNEFTSNKPLKIYEEKANIPNNTNQSNLIEVTSDYFNMSKQLFSDYENISYDLPTIDANLPKSKMLDVPIIAQAPELPTGCEITAIAMMLTYSGANVDKVILANEMPKSLNPFVGYVGDPFEASGWTIYPSALTNIIKKYAGSCENLTGCSTYRLEKQIADNKPVVVWISDIYGFDVHALTLVGYDDANLYFNDPWTGEKEIKIDKVYFLSKWVKQSNRAISY